MSSSNYNTPPIEVLLRDVKYDVALFNVHGASYRHIGSDPRLIIREDGLFSIREGESVHTAPFGVTQRRLNVVEAYGGIEELLSIELPNVEMSSPGNIVFPRSRGAGGTALPILVPIARLSIQHAAVSLAGYRGQEPAIHTAKAELNSVTVYVDWEMSHRSHRLLFDTPGFHIGIQGVWNVDNRRLGHTGASFALSPTGRNNFISSLRLLLTFDQELIRVALSRAQPDLSTNFMREVSALYDEIGGLRRFGHPLNQPDFQHAVEMIGERVASQPGLQTYYRLTC